MTGARVRAVAGLAAVGLGCAVTLAGCGRLPATRAVADPGTRVADATDRCAAVVGLVRAVAVETDRADHRLDGGATATARLSALGGTLEAEAAATRDDVVQQSLQDLVDALRAYRAVLPDRGGRSYRDVATDLRGRLSGFRRTCPVAPLTAGPGAPGWSATSVASLLAVGTGRSSLWPALVVTNGSGATATVGATDRAGSVDRTWRLRYRVGVWARASAGTPALTLRVREAWRGSIVGRSSRTVTLGPGWTFVGLTYRATGRGGPLALAVTAAEVPPGASVSLDALAVARG